MIYNKFLEAKKAEFTAFEALKTTFDA